MNQLIAATVFWSLLAVPLYPLLKFSCRKLLPEDWTGEQELPNAIGAICTLMLAWTIAVVGGFAFDVLPRLYGVLMEAAK